MSLRITPKSGDKDLEGYCNWGKGEYNARVYLGNIYQHIKKQVGPHEERILPRFVGRFWAVYFHEVIGHGLGHKLGIKGHASKKDGHLWWVEDTATIAWLEQLSPDEKYSIVRPWADLDPLVVQLQNDRSDGEALTRMIPR
jgi:hypothetical protein